MFEKAPCLVIIFSTTYIYTNPPYSTQNYSIDLPSCFIIPYIKNQSNTGYITNWSNNYNKVTVTWLSNTVTYFTYNERQNLQGDPTYQCNRSGTNYYWLSF